MADLDHRDAGGIERSGDRADLLGGEPGESKVGLEQSGSVSLERAQVPLVHRAAFVDLASDLAGAPAIEHRTAEALAADPAAFWNGGGVPDDVAAVVSFLATPGAQAVTGQTICPDGGLVLR